MVSKYVIEYDIHVFSGLANWFIMLADALPQPQLEVQRGKLFFLNNLILLLEGRTRNIDTYIDTGMDTHIHMHAYIDA